MHPSDAHDCPIRKTALVLLGQREGKSRAISIAELPVTDRYVGKPAILIENDEHDFPCVRRPEATGPLMHQRCCMSAVLSASLCAVEVLGHVMVGILVAVSHDLALLAAVRCSQEHVAHSNDPDLTLRSE